MWCPACTLRLGLGTGLDNGRAIFAGTMTLLEWIVLTVSAIHVQYVGLSSVGLACPVVSIQPKAGFAKDEGARVSPHSSNRPAV